MGSDQLHVHVVFAVKDLVDPKGVHTIDLVCMLFLSNIGPCFEGWCGGWTAEEWQRCTQLKVATICMRMTCCGCCMTMTNMDLIVGALILPSPRLLAGYHTATPPIRSATRDVPCA